VLNDFKTLLLLGLISGLLLAVGAALGGRVGLTFGLMVAVVMNLGTWWFSVPLVKRMTGARTVHPNEWPDLHRLVGELAQQARLPKPEVLYTEDPVPNAFATGRSPRHAAVAVTKGLVERLDEREVRAVLAHEMAHVLHRDTLISAIAGTLAAAITFLARMAFWFGGSRSRGGNPLVFFLTIFLAPMAAMLIKMAISRTREFQADATGARLCGDPEGLALALERIHGVTVPAELGQDPLRQSTSHMMIANPFSKSLFSTHPPMEERVRRLRAMAKAGATFRGI